MNTIHSFLEVPPISDFIRKRELMHQKYGRTDQFFSEYRSQIEQQHFSNKQLPAEIVTYASLEEVNRLGQEVEDLHGHVQTEKKRVAEYEEELAVIRKKAKQKQTVIVCSFVIVLLLALVIYLFSR